jgi:hypothetical protein
MKTPVRNAGLPGIADISFSPCVLFDSETNKHHLTLAVYFM